MEIGTKPIPTSVLTAVTNLALNAASVFPSRRIEISDSHTDLNRSATFQYSGWTRLCKILKSRPFVPGNGRSLLPAHLQLARQVCPVHEAIGRGKTKYYHLHAIRAMNPVASLASRNRRSEDVRRKVAVKSTLHIHCLRQPMTLASI